MPHETSWASPKNHMVDRGINIGLLWHRMPRGRSRHANPGERGIHHHPAAPGIPVHPLYRGFDAPVEIFSAEPAERSDASGTPKADGDLFTFDDDRHLTGAAGDLQHRLHVPRGRFDIDIVVFCKGLTSLSGIGSPRLAVDADASCHWPPPSF